LKVRLLIGVVLAIVCAGVSAENGYAALSAQPCSGGASAGQFPCENILLQSQIKLSRFPDHPVAASNLWGYVDPDDNREYALVGLSNQLAVVEVTNPTRPRIVGAVSGHNSSWREVKAYSVFNSKTGKWDGYAYVVTEADQGGLQVIDLSDLPDSVRLVRTDREISTAHTLLISNVDWATGAALPGPKPYLYVMGANRAQFQAAHEESGPGRGLTVFDLTNPKNPAIVGTYDETYMHDIYVETITDSRVSQCAPGHNPCEVVFGYTGSAGFRTIDFTDKTHPVVLGTLQYSGLGFAHSGWISQNKKWLFSFDEFDEFQSGNETRIRSILVSDLRHPRSRISWRGRNSHAIEHNGYVAGDKLYVSFYTKGLAVFDVKHPKKLRLIGSFDTRPENDNTAFEGAWGVYPFLPSGNILISDMQRGLFVLKEQ